MPPMGGFINTGSDNSALVAAAIAAGSNRLPYTDGFGGGGLSALVLASLLGGRGGFGFGNGTTADNNNIILADLRKDVGDAALEAAKVESRIQAAIQVQDTNNQVNFRALDNKICEVQKDAIIVGKDAIINSLQIEARATDRLNALSTNMEHHFCKVEADIKEVKCDLGLQIERGFCELREKTLQDQLDELRRKVACGDNSLISAQISNLTGLVNSTLQEQKQNNKTVQIGTGLIATPSNSQTNVH